MDNSVNVSRPDSSSVVGAEQPQTQKPEHRHPKLLNGPNSYSNKWPKLVMRLILVIIFLAGLLGVGKILQNSSQNNANQSAGISTVNTSEYQAVFLTNGQVYFGKIQFANQYYLKLTDIYYLQVQQSVQPASSTATQPSSTSATTSSTSTGSSSSNSNNNTVQLIKLGNELHAPEDEMTIMRPQILFWENMKPSGKVSQAIANYQSKQ